MAWLNSEITWAANEGSDSLLNVIREKVDRFNAINVATALHRLARLGDSKALAENEAFQSLVQKTSSVLGLSLTQCDAKAVSTIAHAVASLGLRDVSVASGVVVASLARVHDFDRQGIANVAWALAKMPKVKGRLKLAKKLAMRSQQFLMEFSPQELCNVSDTGGFSGFSTCFNLFQHVSLLKFLVLLFPPISTPNKNDHVSPSLFIIEL